MAQPEQVPGTRQRELLSEESFSLLKVYAYYRITLATVFSAMFLTHLAPNILGKENPGLFSYTIGIYTVITFITLIRLYSSRFTPSHQHMFLVCLVDITAMTLLMHSSGGISSGLGLLLFITISASSIILPKQIATLTAALATIAVIAESIFNLMYATASMQSIMTAGLLGILLFSTSQLFLYLTKRMREAAEEAELQTLRRQHLQQLNELIVQRMRTGIIVLAPNGAIRLINESAARLLEIPLTMEQNSEFDFSFAEIPSLYECLQNWRGNPRARISPIKIRDTGPELQLSFAGLEDDKNADIIVFVEDTRDVAQQAQQLKLASLGHLTASIAHEVRNPLGAISHAAQLLAESDTIDKHDHRLTEIIQNHSLRVNQIIENVLQLSRRKNPAPETLNLKLFLNKFVSNYLQAHSESLNISIDVEPADITITADPSQLEQVLNNLSDNGLYFSQKKTGEATLLLKGYIDHSLDTPCLDIIDDGPGIPNNDIAKVFEPFFTTSPKGTGLGLYLARELCEANQARLDYHFSEQRKSCFQISFAHPDKALKTA